MIDFLSQRNAGEQNLQDLINNQGTGIAPGIDQTRQSIMQGRDYLNGQLSNAGNQVSANLGLGPNTNQAIQASYQPQEAQMNRQLEGQLAQQKLNQQSNNTNLKFSNAMRLAQERGMDHDQAVEFARQYAVNDQSNQFQAQQSAANRAAAMTRDQLAAQYSKMGLNAQLTANRDAQPDYGSALMRILAGTGTAIGTGYLINKYNQQPADYSSGAVGPGTSLRQQSGFYDPYQFQTPVNNPTYLSQLKARGL